MFLLFLKNNQKPSYLQQLLPKYHSSRCQQHIQQVPSINQGFRTFHPKKEGMEQIKSSPKLFLVMTSWQC